MPTSDHLRSNVAPDLAPAWATWGSDHAISAKLPARRLDRVYVYVLWGRGRRPLYVGKARNPWARLGAHMSDKPWAPSIRRVECHGFPSEKAALEAELEAIAHLNPVHNVLRHEPRSAIRERDEWWRQHQAKKRADLVARKAAEAERSRAWEERRAAWAAAKAAAPPKVVRQPKPKPVLLEPRTTKRVRRQKWRDDLFTPDQLAIIRRVQNRGRAA